MSIPFSNTNYRIPQGFANLLEGLTREVLREQPKDIPQFAAKYFAGILKKREESGFDPAEWGAALQDRYYNNHSFQDFGDTTFTSHIGGVSDRGQSVSVSDRLVDLPSSVPEEEHKNDANEQRTEAATVIQAAFRGHLAREEVEKLRMQPGENLVSEEGSLFSLPEQSGVREKQSIESESPDLKATEPLSAIEEPESGQEQEPQTHEAPEEPERRQEQEPQTHEATEELESGQEQEPQTLEATKERESWPEQEPQTHEAPEEPERGHEQEPQTHEATKEPESGQEQEPQTHEATEEPQSGQEQEPQTHEATEELESGQELEPQTHEATEEPERGEEHEPQTHEATQEPEKGQEQGPQIHEATEEPESGHGQEPQTHEATEEPESGHGQEPQTHEATQEPESVQEQEPNTHEATEEPESGQEQGPQTHEDTEEPENGQEQEPQTHEPHFTVDENEVTGIQYNETLLAEQPVLEDTSDRTAETMTVTIGDQADSDHLEENEALRKQPEEALDIALDDPDANAAAAKIQAGFRGHMTRKKMKTGDKDLKHDKDDSAQGEHEGD